MATGPWTGSQVQLLLWGQPPTFLSAAAGWGTGKAEGGSQHCEYPRQTPGGPEWPRAQLDAHRTEHWALSDGRGEGWQHGDTRGRLFANGHKLSGPCLLRRQICLKCPQRPSALGEA